MAKCDSCGAMIAVEAIIDSEIWERIANGAYALCPPCMDARIKALGIRVECDLQFCGLAMRSVVTARVEKAGAWRVPERVNYESVGLPGLYVGEHRQ